MSHDASVTVPWSKQLGRQAILMFATIVTLYPVLWVLKIAFSEQSGFGSSLVPWPEHPTLANFGRVMGAVDSAGEPVFFRQVWNSTVVSLATTAVGIAVSTTAAYAFSRFDFPGRNTGMRVFLITQMFPGVVMAVPLYILLDELHLLDSMLGLTIVYSTTSVPFCVWMLKGYFDTIPRELEEAAEMDGATGWQRFRLVTLPLLKPALLPAVVLGSVWTFNMFNVIYLVSGGEPDGSTDILVSQAYRWAFTRGHRYGYGAAYAVIIFGVMLVQSRVLNRLAGRKVV
jgi:arabinogalactan oligomer/maltooligosaccharide transport system permease protein